MRLALFLLLATACTSAFASPYFVGNPYSPVPPTCIVNPHPSPVIFEALNGNAVRVWNGEVRLLRADDPQPGRRWAGHRPGRFR